MLTLGVFSLAAPKRNGVGNAYVVIEGPNVSGVAIFETQSDKSAGADAFAFAAAVNNAARAALAAEPGRPQRIDAAREALQQAKDRSTLDNTEATFVQKVEELPVKYQNRFTKERHQI